MCCQQASYCLCTGSMTPQCTTRTARCCCGDSAGGQWRRSALPWLGSRARAHHSCSVIPQLHARSRVRARLRRPGQPWSLQRDLGAAGNRLVGLTMRKTARTEIMDVTHGKGTPASRGTARFLPVLTTVTCAAQRTLHALQRAIARPGPPWATTQHERDHQAPVASHDGYGQVTGGCRRHVG